MTQKIQVEVVEREGVPGSWTVEAIRFDVDGAIEQRIFIGEGAKERAYEYAWITYGWAPDPA